MTTACSTPSSAGQCRLDLTEFDAVAADLDLFVGAPEILQLPVGAPRAPDPRCDTSAPRAPRTDRPQTATRSTRTGAKYPTPTPRAGDIQLTDHPGGHRAQPPVEHEQRRPRHRRADRHPRPRVSTAR